MAALWIATVDVTDDAAYAEYDVLVDGALHRDAATKSRTLARFIDELASAASAPRRCGWPISWSIR